jgi:hypothetical protein
MTKLKNYCVLGYPTIVVRNEDLWRLINPYHVEGSEIPHA